jgi:hypothetical protein
MLPSLNRVSLDSHLTPSLMNNTPTAHRRITIVLDLHLKLSFK